MTLDRHPLAEEFKQAIRLLRTQTAALHDPDLRGKAISGLRKGLSELLRGEPPPWEPLRQVIYALQRDLGRLAKSKRAEFALASRVDEELSHAERLLAPSPVGSEPPPGPPPGAPEATTVEIFVAPSRDGWAVGDRGKVLRTFTTKAAALQAAMLLIRARKLAEDRSDVQQRPGKGSIVSP